MLTTVKIRDIPFEEMINVHRPEEIKGYRLTNFAKAYWDGVKGKDAIIETTSIHKSSICGGKSWYVKGGTYYEMSRKVDPIEFEFSKDFLSVCENLLEVD